MEKFEYSSSILDDILRFEVICTWVTIFDRFFSWSGSFLKSQFSFFCKTEHRGERKNQSPNQSPNQSQSQSQSQSRAVLSQQNVKVDERSLCREEIEGVMERLAIFCNPDEEKLQERLCPVEIAGLFEEKEPSLEELNEAFLVFDVNRDGFIDAEELQRVLRLLGFRQGTGVDDCKKMITSHDENGDGRIDFNEFVKFTEDFLS